MELTDLKIMARDPLVHIGSHSDSHVLFHEKQDRDFMVANLRRSRDLIQKEWKLNAHPTFCYPNGDHHVHSGKLCADAGYPMSFVTNSGFVGKRTDPQFIPRFWLSTPRRTLIICAFALFGNKALKMVGR